MSYNFVSLRCRLMSIPDTGHVLHTEPDGNTRPGTFRSRSLWAQEARPNAGPTPVCASASKNKVFWTLLLAMVILALGRALEGWWTQLSVRR